MGIPLLSDVMQLRSVAFKIHFTNIWGGGGGGTVIIAPVKPYFVCEHVGS